MLASSCLFALHPPTLPHPTGGETWTKRRLPGGYRHMWKIRGSQDASRLYVTTYTGTFPGITVDEPEPNPIASLWYRCAGST